MTGPQYINVGEITGVFGLKGWVKVYSYTVPRENILSYSVWRLEKNNQVQTVDVVAGKLQGKSVVASFDKVQDRTMAEGFIGWSVWLSREQLPTPKEGEYYWVDLVGLHVVTVDGVDLGRVDYLLETGANDVLVVQGDRERLIPFIKGQVVVDINLETGTLIVDWDLDF